MRKIRFFQKNTYLSIDYKAQEVETWRLVPQDGGMPRIDGGKLDVVRDEPLRRELADSSAPWEGRAPGVTGSQGRAALVLANEIVARMADRNDMEIDVAIAERARRGEVLTELELHSLDAADVLSLGMLADEARRARVGDLVGYARVLTSTPTPWKVTVPCGMAAADEVRLTTLGTTLDETVARITRTREQIGPRPA